MNTTNNMSARESFQQAKAALFNAILADFKGDAAAANKFINGLTMSQGEIRVEVILSTTSNAFTFGINPNQSNSNNVQFATENRLNVQDAFVANEYGIFVAKTSGATDTAFNLRTYGNTQDFTGGEAAALDEQFYSNGAFTLRANNEILVPYRGLFNHLYRPQTQQTDALGAASPGDQVRGAEDGFITLEPNVTLRGNVNYVPQILLPGALAAAANVRAVLIFRGVLAQNVLSR